ncbi:acyl-CoA thioesterase [Chloroflexota bacterium]
MTELVLTYRGTIYPWHCDHMGHMNVMWYTGKFDEATWQFFNMVGLTPAYMSEQARGMVAARQNTSYRHEVNAGDLITVWSGVLEARQRLLRFYHEMRNEVSGDIVATTVLTGVHIDTQTRKPTPFPDDLLEHFRQITLDYDPVL